MTTGNVNLTGKTALVTGATSGIGEASAMALASMGATLYLLCRNKAKGQATQQRIEQQTGNSDTHLLIADMAEQAQIRVAAQKFLDTKQPLHILLNNAGITNTKRRETVDGIEETFAVNHLGPFLLTHLLMPSLKLGSPSRIVNVASNAHHFVKGMQFDDLGFKQNYKTFKVYGQSKLANLLFTLALSSRLNNCDITVNAIHPGAVATGIGSQNGLLGKIVPLIIKPFFRSAEKGAESSIYACVSPEMENISGRYLYNCKELRPKPWALDTEQAQRLWQESEALVGIISTD